MATLFLMVTVVIDDGQGRDAAVSEDGQRSDERRVWVDVGDVGVRPHTELLQSLLHEGWHGHFTHLSHTHTHTDLFITVGISGHSSRCSDTHVGRLSSRGQYYY